MSGFNAALEHVLGVEGGFADHPNDRGGATNYGITEGVYHDWLRAQGKELRPVREISRGEVLSIYHERYWLEGKCDAMPWPVSLSHFDSVVNHGIRNGTKLLQRALGVAADGIIGPITLGAVEQADLARLLRAMWWGRIRFYTKIVFNDHSQKAFIAGWVDRIRHLRERCIRDHPEVA